MPPDIRRLYEVLKSTSHSFDPNGFALLLAAVDQRRVDVLAASLERYISTNLTKAVGRRNGLADYRSNPYVMLTSARIMDLLQPDAFASFLFNTKLYAGLETSFGRSIEAEFVQGYPIGSLPHERWQEPPEKREERDRLTAMNLSRENRARVRSDSVWREIDKSCVVGNRRYLLSIKCGPNCINDTQVDSVTNTIANRRGEWMRQTQVNCPDVDRLDVVLGITYGTERTTNNKENQVLVKLLERGFVEEDRGAHPGVLIDSASRTIRVYRCIGQDFWSFIGNPGARDQAPFVFVEILLALACALSKIHDSADLEAHLNAKIRQLASALMRLRFPRNSIPPWISQALSPDELYLLTTAVTAFYDEGI